MRAAAMLVVMAAGSRLTRCRALKCLNMAPGVSGVLWTWEEALP